jgi:methionyl-tRNA synthetase
LSPEGFDAKHVMYVWLDALSNYLTGVNGLSVEGQDTSLTHFWPADVHVIGKDILWFHTVIWPCLLMSAGLALPKTVFAHGFVNDKDGKKMSKSLGNVVDPHDMLDKFDVDTFRW